ncbi:MAG: sugar transferase, partial [Akkermansiaceae bacterium]
GANDQDTLEKLYYDLYYVREHSLMLDAMIIVKTIYTVIFGRGQ